MNTSLLRGFPKFQTKTYETFSIYVYFSRINQRTLYLIVDYGRDY